MNITQKALVERFLPLANKLAFQRKKSLPNFIDFEEIQSAAYLGLCESAGRFDETKGVCFSTFVYPRILGAINDYLREYGYSKTISLDVQVEGGSSLAETIIDERVDRNEDLLDLLSHELDDNAKIVLKSYFFDALSMKEVGNLLGVTEGRISQMISKYKQAIRDKWNQDELVELAA
jgi:RNA polymerase sigma factor (sigma-70 family)